MSEISSIITYVFLFVSLYFEIFLLITYFENRSNIKKESKELELNKVKKYPTVTIIIPCWNEEKTVSKTVNSLLNLDYPKDKLSIMIIDDGSTDNTWGVIQKFKNKKQIQMFRKENGGKYTALNFGLSQSKSDLVGCLDADSYVDKDALKNIVYYFEDKETMSVTPSVKVWKPKKIIQMIQKVEYDWGVFLRKMFSYLGAIYVTPGPFSIFRKEVFEKLGGYRHAYQTEDMELAVRMQTNHYKIVNAHDAVVYTVAPDSVKKLYKQRLRWTYGFIKNVIDYRHLFSREYGNLGIFILPLASISIISALYIIFMAILDVLFKLFQMYTKWSIVGFDIRKPDFHLDWFFIDTSFMTIISILSLTGIIALLFVARKMSEKKFAFGMDLVYFLTLYAFISPLWMFKAVYNAIFSVKTYWR